MSTSDFTFLTSRVERLERQNRFYKRGAMLFLLSLIAFIAMGESRPSRTVEAEQFILRDTQGRQRLVIGTPNASGAALGLTPDEPVIWITGKSGADRAILSSDGLRFADENGKALASMDVANSNPAIRFLNDKGVETMYLSPARLEMRGKSDFGSGIYLDDEDGFVRVSLNLIRDQPSVIVNDRQGFSAELGSTDLETTRAGGQRKTSAASLVLRGSGDKVIWSAP
jgi:hypothetical protein